MTAKISSAQETADELGLPWNVANPALVAYRSVGIGVFGAFMRFAGMPLEKIALFMNSAQVQGKGQFSQAARLTFQEGVFAPYKVVGPSSMTAWFLQYSVMGVAFQFFDHSISEALGVTPVYYGRQLLEPNEENDAAPSSADYKARYAIARLLSPIMSASLESMVSNRAEVQRFFGPQQFTEMQARLRTGIVTRMTGPAFVPNAMRNVIMCQTSFLITPLTYKLYFPQEHKSASTLFWYGLGVNMFVGNVAAITQQALWGRSLDYFRQYGQVNYTATIRQGLQSEGLAAFFTGPKWFSRVLMNAPAQGTLPWFYNEVLPLGEEAVLRTVQAILVPGEERLHEPHRVRVATVSTIKPTLRRSNSATFGATSPRR
eukprot:scaffold3408_cov129-Amphora_coffeaeformis.AAC.11